MDLAFVTGYGPALLTDIEGRRPLVRPEDAVAFAFRDHEDQAEFGSQPLPAKLAAYDLYAVRRLGIETVVRAAVTHLTRRRAGRLLHPLGRRLSRRCPYAGGDFRMPGGLSWDELAVVLRIGPASGKAVGLEVAIHNPHLDKDRSAGRGLADVLAATLASSSCEPLPKTD
jgi:arginase